jgi:hypothetical protein
MDSIAVPSRAVVIGDILHVRDNPHDAIGSSCCKAVPGRSTCGSARGGSGRLVGVRLNNQDVMNRSCGQRHYYAVESLDHWDRDASGLREALEEDKRSTPAEIAAIRIDLSAWLARLPRAARGPSPSCSPRENRRCLWPGNSA